MIAEYVNDFLAKYANLIDTSAQVNTARRKYEKDRVRIKMKNRGYFDDSCAYTGEIILVKIFPPTGIDIDYRRYRAYRMLMVSL